MRTIKILLVAVAILALSATGFAQTNASAFFRLDTNLSTAGFQETTNVTGIGASKYVGFAIYIKNYDALRSYDIDVTYDGTKAALNGTFTSNIIEENDLAINGPDVITLAAENNLLTNPLESPGTVNTSGHYYTLWAQAGGSALASTEYGLAGIIVLKTTSTFTTATPLSVTVTVKVTNDNLVEKELGTRTFYVNSGYTDVQTSTWGEVKSQFKN